MLDLLDPAVEVFVEVFFAGFVVVVYGCCGP